MRTRTVAARRRITLEPGEYHASPRDVILETLLGSCVAACLFDPVARVVGMNHFLLSNHRHPPQAPLVLSEAGRYGIHAMELLVNRMLQLGAAKKNLRAKAFGGASLFPSGAARDEFLGVGEVNSRFLREFLEAERIPLSAADLGGQQGRVIAFDARDYSVTVRKIGRAANDRVHRRDRDFWKRRLATQQHERPEVDLWH